MNMANKNQTGLFPEASQDMTGNSNESKQNLLKFRLLKFRLIGPKSSRSRTRIRKLCHLQKSAIYGRKGRKTWLTFQSCCVYCVKSYVNQYLQQKSIVNKQSTCFRLALNEQRHQWTKEIITLGESDKTRLTFETYLLLLNPHSLRQVEAPAGQKSTIIIIGRSSRLQNNVCRRGFPPF